MELYIGSIGYTKVPTGHDVFMGYDKTVRHLEKMIPKNGEYMFEEYTAVPKKKGRKYYTILIKHETATRVLVRGKTNIELVPTREQKGLWWDPPFFWKDGFHQRSSGANLGFNTCGRHLVQALDEYDQVLNETYVTVVPRQMTLEQYYVMENEVRDIFESSLSTRPANSDLLKESKKELYNLHNFEKLVNETNYWLNEIIKHPEEKLIKEQIKVKKQQIRKWDSRSLLELQLYPFRERISTTTNIKSHHIIEHQMILHFLERLLDRCVREIRIENSILLQLQKEWEERQALISTLQNSQEIAQAERRCLPIRSDFDLLKERSSRWGHLVYTLRHWSDDPLFQVDSEPFEYTHLFQIHPIYNNIPGIMDDFDMIEPKLENSERESVEQIMKSPYLYEVWVLLQLDSELKRFRFFPETPIAQSLIAHIQKTDGRINDLSGWKSRYKNGDIGDTIGLYYEPLVNGLTPDYLLLYKKHGGSTWDGHVIDAKYKPYSLMSPDILKLDIKHSCLRYLDTLTIQDVIFKSASLLHIDPAINLWNYESPETYLIKCISVQPQKKENLNILIKQILHYHAGRGNICPSCGHNTQTLKGQLDFKKTYICQQKDCGEVWVDSVCWNRTAHRKAPAKFRLFKYQHNNYNRQRADQWDVYCPICNKSFSDRPHRHSNIKHSGFTPIPLPFETHF
ncbi:hypothetical protein [Peribacillus frigoritolerans]|uniref:hypothetical protein n=1 Tax=Peribacillus frigoritolerans TaxID=450367 RepID=UPI003428D51E